MPENEEEIERVRRQEEGRGRRRGAAPDADLIRKRRHVERDLVELAKRRDEKGFRDLLNSMPGISPESHASLVRDFWALVREYEKRSGGRR